MRLSYIILISSCIGFAACKKYTYNFDNGYPDYNDSAATISVDTSIFKVDSSLYSKAKVFPGLVNKTERRIPDTSISFNLNYSYLSPAEMGVVKTPLPVFSTGLYAAPGEYIQIDVPNGVYGLTARVGSHLDNLSSSAAPLRDANISTVKALFPGTNYVKNLYGGYIWLEAARPVSQPVNLQFKNAIRSADFILGVTSFTDWKNQVLNYGAPWLELRTKRICFSVPTTSVVAAIQSGAINNLEAVLTEWDKVIYNDMFGSLGFTDGAAIKNRAPLLPDRAVLDLQPLDGLTHSGFPIVAKNNLFWFNEWATDLQKLQSGNAISTLELLLQNYTQANNPWWSGMDTVALNLFSLRTAIRNNKLSSFENYSAIVDVLSKAISYATVDTAGKYIAYDPIIKDNWGVRTIPFLQIFDRTTNPATGQSGWDFLGYFLSAARVENNFGSTDMAKYDFFYKTLSEYTQKDCFAFMDAWGIPVSTGMRSYIMNRFPAMEKAIWTYDPINKTGGDNPATSRKFHDRINWTIVASTEEKVQEAGTGYGFATNMLDGNPVTFWHTQWSPSSTPPPYIINVDMHEENTVSGFYLTSRYSATYPENIIIEVSNDGANYQNVANIVFLVRANKQYFPLSQVRSFRYFRLTITSAYGASNAALSELGTYYNN